MSAPELRVFVKVADGRLELADLAGLVEAVALTRNRRWRRRAIQHVAALSGVPVRDVVREVNAAERRWPR